MHSPVSSPFLLSTCTQRPHLQIQVPSGCLSCLLVCPIAVGITAGSDRLTCLSSHRAPGCSHVQSILPWHYAKCYGNEGICRNLAALVAVIGMLINKTGCRKYSIPSLPGSAALLQIACAMVHRSLGYNFP